MTEERKKIINRRIYQKAATLVPEKDKVEFARIIKNIPQDELLLVLRMILNCRPDPIGTVKRLMAHPQWQEHCARRDRDFEIFERENLGMEATNARK